MKRIVFSLVLFVVVSIAYHVSTREQKADYRVVENTSTTKTNEHLVPESVDLVEFEEDMDQLLEEVAPALPEGVLEDELVLRFPNEGDMASFLSNAKSEGLHVLSLDKRLKAVRLRLDDPEDASRISELVGDLADLDFNYEVFSPSPPIPQLDGAGSVGFDQSALSWLGVPKDNETWGKGVRIAILDSGVGEHRVLEGSAITSIDVLDTSGYPIGESGHGTAVASIIGGGNGLGIAPAAELLSIRVLGEDGVGDSFSLAQGIMEAADRGADVISMSLGSFGYSGLLGDAVEYAHSKGVLMVASVGNEGRSEITYPARFDNVIGVAAVDANGQHSNFSNYGEGVDIAAPGVGVVAAWDDEQWISFTGTSAAVPFVAGGVAGLMSSEGISNPADAYGLLVSNANDATAPGPDVRTGAGVLNIERVLDRNQTGIVDAAMADVFVDLESADHGEVPVVMTVENRGTQFLNAVELRYSVNNLSQQSVYLGALSSGSEASYTVFVSEDVLFSEEGLQFSASSHIAQSEDTKPNNNSREGSFSLIVPED